MVFPVLNSCIAIEKIRAEIGELAQETGVPVDEFRRIVQTVQKGEREARQAKKEMVEANLRLVISIAKKYTNRGLNLRHMVDSSGHYALYRGPSPHHSYSCAYD